MYEIIIISTGDELLYGTTINTNSSFISRMFFGSNFKVIKHIIIGDEIEAIVSSLNQSMQEADIVITTGGLGPTDDDNTVEAVCRVFNIHAVIDKESDSKTIDYFCSMNYSINSLDKKMSNVPENSYVIQNKYGLAPGFIINSDNKVVISLPGVPTEAENMMMYDVMPYLHKKYLFHDNPVLTYKMSGIRESDLNSSLNELDLHDIKKICITSKSGVCDLIITGNSNFLNTKEINDMRIRSRFEKFIIEHNASSPEEELILLLKEKNLTLSTAESCTGGLIAKRITDIAGSSEVYKGSIIAYSNDIKKNFLDVPSEIIDRFGAVSENTAAEMAVSVQNKFNTDISVSTTGIAGPGGGSEAKPIGTVCFGFKIGENLITYTKNFKGNRERIRNFSSLYAINYLRDYLKFHSSGDSQFTGSNKI